MEPFDRLNLGDVALLLALLLAVILALLALVVATVNVVGRHFRRHDEWMRRLTLSVQNLHAERQSRNVRVLQRRTPRPPTLSGAPTVEVTDDMLTRATARYTIPPKEDPPDDAA